MGTVYFIEDRKKEDILRKCKSFFIGEVIVYDQ